MRKNCQRIRVPAVMHSDTLQREGESQADPELRRWYLDKAAEIRGTVYDHRHEESWAWTCGPGPRDPQCQCGAIADALCDYPIGKGKTCDIGMCEEHRNRAGEDVDFCPVHIAEYRGKAGEADVVMPSPRRPWPPKRNP